ncbi:SDR family oxidoreductase [Rhizobium rhizophilum]|uniref:SDR family oxidoreductase n=1 Tax=Rhizobium rhizophilum TaxID=1850373 RepID=A0ABY2QRN6_9HYPH|nr:SDR family oxidoreductase [Rhizobium rhizophilum]THV12520.1 SDR family oxidoreductase [Rhizobium rhizophilum]
MTLNPQAPTSRRRLALVTGANKGIGFAISRQLAKAGLQVVLGARDREKGEDAARSLRWEGLEADALCIDLDDLANIPEAAAIFEQKFGCLDILVNNAGIASQEDGPPETASVEAVRQTFQTNFFGTLAVTQAFLPLLKKSKSGRIVNVSSELGSITHNGDPEWPFAGHKLIGYNASKAALNMLTAQLAAELKPLGILVNSADPGFTATDLNGYQGFQAVEQGAVAPVKLALIDDDGPTGGYFGADRGLPW